MRKSVTEGKVLEWIGNRQKGYILCPRSMCPNVASCAVSPSSHRHPHPQVFQGVLERNMEHNLFLMGKRGAKLDVLLENMGRLSFGSNSSDFKVS